LEVERNPKNNKRPGGDDGEKGSAKDVEDRVHGNQRVVGVSGRTWSLGRREIV